MSAARELSAIYRDLPGILFYVSVDADGEFRFRSMSQAGLAAMGLTQDRVVGRLVQDVVPSPSCDLVLNHYRQAIRSGHIIRWKETSAYPGGQRVGEVAVRALYDDNGVATHVIGVVHDVTGRDHLEQLVEAWREHAHNRELETLLETSTQGVVSIDESGAIVMANRALANMFGWPREKLIGQQVEVLMPSIFRTGHELHRKNYLGAPHARLIGGGMQFVGERRDGSTFPIEVSLNHISTVKGTRVFAFVTDITERRQMEEALSNVSRKLIQSQEQERARIGRELHDDISQRLAMLAITLQQLEDHPSDAKKSLGELRHEVVELSQDVQALSHELHSSRLEYLGVVEGMRGWCSEFGEWQGVVVHFASDLSISLPFEIGICLFRVLQEALHNGVKHGGAKRIEVGLHQDSAGIRLTVSDSGRGFEIHTALHGRGVGLASMQERVRILNGTISILSQPMGGTVIDVRVPLGLRCDAQPAVASA